jgi:hypothetical protein
MNWVRKLRVADNSYRFAEIWVTMENIGAVYDLFPRTMINMDRDCR